MNDIEVLKVYDIVDDNDEGGCFCILSSDHPALKHCPIDYDYAYEFTREFQEFFGLQGTRITDEFWQERPKEYTTDEYTCFWMKDREQMDTFLGDLFMEGLKMIKYGQTYVQLDRSL